MGLKLKMRDKVRVKTLFNLNNRIGVIIQEGPILAPNHDNTGNVEYDYAVKIDDVIWLFYARELELV